jgi:hypothetical protein
MALIKESVMPQTYTVTFDDLDNEAFLEEIALRKGRPVPDGESCELGTHIAEMVRDLREYRDLCEAHRKSDVLFGGVL